MLSGSCCSLKSYGVVTLPPLAPACPLAPLLMLGLGGENRLGEGGKSLLPAPFGESAGCNRGGSFPLIGGRGPKGSPAEGALPGTIAGARKIEAGPPPWSGGKVPGGLIGGSLGGGLAGTGTGIR